MKRGAGGGGALAKEGKKCVFNVCLLCIVLTDFNENFNPIPISMSTVTFICSSIKKVLTPKTNRTCVFLFPLVYIRLSKPIKQICEKLK